MFVKEDGRTSSDMKKCTKNPLSDSIRLKTGRTLRSAKKIMQKLENQPTKASSFKKTKIFSTMNTTTLKFPANESLPERFNFMLNIPEDKIPEASTILKLIIMINQPDVSSQMIRLFHSKNKENDATSDTAADRILINDQLLDNISSDNETIDLHAYLFAIPGKNSNLNKTVSETYLCTLQRKKASHCLFFD